MDDNAGVSQSTAAKKTIPCEECEKPLSSKQSLANYVSKIYRKIVDTYRSPLVQSTSSAMDANMDAPPSLASSSVTPFSASAKALPTSSIATQNVVPNQGSYSAQEQSQSYKKKKKYWCGCQRITGAVC